MKRYLLIFLCFISVSGYAQWYRTTQFAKAAVINGHYYWEDWEDSNMNLCIDIENNIIVIYSPMTQVYKIYGAYNNGNVYTDPYGGANIMFYVIDQDNDRGNVRLRVEKNGNAQVYIDFNDVAWVYNVVRIQ